MIHLGRPLMAALICFGRSVSMNLPPRLFAIARLIPPGSRVADVGTDHGKLAVWLLEQGVCSCVVATDVAPGPLSAARRNAMRAGVVSGLDFRLADGLAAVSPEEIDMVVIAGMGGETIMRILARTPWLKSESYRIILQPQSKIPELLDFLSIEGYLILAQHFVEDAGRQYTIFEVTAWDYI